MILTNNDLQRFKKTFCKTFFILLARDKDSERVMKFLLKKYWCMKKNFRVFSQRHFRNIIRNIVLNQTNDDIMFISFLFSLRFESLKEYRNIDLLKCEITQSYEKWKDKNLFVMSIVSRSKIFVFKKRNVEICEHQKHSYSQNLQHWWSKFFNSIIVSFIEHITWLFNVFLIRIESS